MKKRVTLLLLCIVSAVYVRGRVPDSMSDSVHGLDEVIVTSRYNYREVIPSQRMRGEELERLSSHSVADALRYFSGLQIKDYGGVGGLKTVNIRSMGTHHVGIYYDGVELGNAQNGQTDLGQLSLDNIEEITLYNGQRSMIFQSASDFGNAGTVYVRTRRPLFDGKGYNVRVKAGYGSSDMFRLSAVYEQMLSRRVNMALSVGGITSSGKYKFRYRRKNLDGSTAYDTTAVRHNGDVQTLRMEGNLYGQLNGGSWDAKIYTYHSERGIPGAIVNNVWRRGERQWDHNTFAQASLQQSIGDRFDTRLKVKYAYYSTRYVNKDTTTMLVDNTFHQQELYVSTANVYDIIRGDGSYEDARWSVAVSYDFKWNKLTSDMLDFAYPHRFQNMAALATALDCGRLKLQGSVLGTFVKDHVKEGVTQKALHKFSPALFVSLQPLRSDVLLLRAFAKQSYRMPTFNDLYYTDIGNSDLVPETAIQYNVGMTIDKTWHRGVIRNVSFQADAYYNTVHDKIIAYPKGQQFRWTMLNLGRVHIKGLDVAATMTAVPTDDLRMMLRVQYTFQRAIDVTDPDDSYYRHQIPYIPRHSGSAIVNIGWHDWDLNYSFIYSGERYNQKENIKRNYMQPWYTSDVSVTYRCRRGLRLSDSMRMPWRVTVEVNNLFSQDYDVVINYPMPKRNYAVTLDVAI